jgi:DNA-binding response OmpR family regulator
MKIATLFRSRAVETCAVLALSAQGLQVARHSDICALVASLRAGCIDASVLEDDERYLGEWLSALKDHGMARFPAVIVGQGDAGGIVRALRHGAADYAALLEGPASIVARLQAQVALRSGDPPRAALQVDGYALDAQQRRFSNGRQEVELTEREFELAWILFESHGRVVSLDSLSMRIWGRPIDISKHSIEQHVYRLRRKLDAVIGEGIAARVRIEAVYGVGYRLELG